MALFITTPKRRSAADEAVVASPAIHTRIHGLNAGALSRNPRSTSRQSNYGKGVRRKYQAFLLVG